MKECSNSDKWFDIEGAMEYLQVSRTTIYAAMKDGRLQYYYVKGTKQRRIKKSDLDALMTPGDANDFQDE